MICPHREKKNKREEEDRNEIQEEEVVVMEKGIDQEREIEIEKGTIIDGFVYMGLHTPPTPDTDITAKPHN
jgi:hypothetical protein